MKKAPLWVLFSFYNLGMKEKESRVEEPGGGWKSLTGANIEGVLVQDAFVSVPCSEQTAMGIVGFRRDVSDGEFSCSLRRSFVGRGKGEFVALIVVTRFGKLGTCTVLGIDILSI